jgi:hypothetical protein
MLQSLDHGGVGVFEVGIFPDEDNVNLIKHAFLAISLASERKLCHHIDPHFVVISFHRLPSDIPFSVISLVIFKPSKLRRFRR